MLCVIVVVDVMLLVLVVIGLGGQSVVQGVILQLVGGVNILQNQNMQNINYGSSLGLGSGLGSGSFLFCVLFGQNNMLIIGGIIQVDLVINVFIIIVSELVYCNLCVVIDDFDVCCVQVYIELMIVEVMVIKVL